VQENDTIGRLLNAWRLQKGLTLQQLADEIGVTAAFISQVENGKASPSIASLRSLAKALGHRVVDFFIDELIEDPMVLPESMWTDVDMPGWDATIRQMVRIAGNKQMQPFYTVIQPKKGSRELFAHPGEEFGVVLKGEMILTLGEQVCRVRALSSFYYSCLLPHSWRNEGEEDCVVVWAVSPPSW
jgi:transcriptional regulator with XRE-family HTH domain